MPETVLKRPVFRILIGLLGTLLGAVFLVALSFTHTQVGRDALRNSLEDWFAEAFDGRLTVADIRGSLLRDLHLLDVRLYDASDSLMIHAGTVSLRPRWLDLPKRKFNVRELDIQDVDLYARFQADSTWNLGSVRHRTAPADTSRAWELESAQITISGGRIITTNETRSRRVQLSHVDPTDLTVDNISLEAQLNWQTDERFVLLHGMSARLPAQALMLTSLAGEAVLQENRWYINSLRLESGPNRVTLTGIQESDSRSFTFFINEIVLSPTLVQALLPNAPVEDTLTIVGTIGIAPQLVYFEDLTLEAGPSFVTASGMMDTESYAVTVTEGALGDDMLQTVLPGSPTLPAIDSLTAEMHGTRDPIRPNASASLNLYAGAGHLAGSIAAVRDTAWTYTVSVHSDEWVLDRMPPGFPLTGSLRGHATLTGSGLRTPDVNIQANLDASAVNGRSLDSLRLAATYAGRVLSGRGSAYLGNSRLEVEGGISWAGNEPDYQLSGQTHTFDISLLWPDSPLESSLNAAWTFSGTGVGANDAVGSLEIRLDSSEVAWSQGRSAVLPHRWTVALDRPQRHAVGLHIGGDVLNLEAAGRLEFSALRAVSEVWMMAVRDSRKRQADKRRSRPPTSTVAFWPPLEQFQAVTRAENAMARTPLNQLSVDAQWQVLRGDLLPGLPALTAGHTGSMMLRGNPYTLDIGMDLFGADLSTESWSVQEAALSLQASAHINAPLERSLKLSGTARAERLTGPGTDLVNAGLDWHLEAGSGGIRLEADESDGPGSGEISASFEMQEDRNRLTVGTAAINIRGASWLMRQPARIDLFGDGAVFDPLVLESTIANTGRSQRLQFSGALSGAAEDTFKVSLENLILEQLSNTLGLARRRLGGNLNARLQWTGLGSPEITGLVEVDTLSLNRRMVGAFRAESQLVPGSDDLQVRTVVRPPDRYPDHLIHAENDLTVEGRVRPPGADRTGQLDLIVDLKRLDAGFLEEMIPILEGVTGGISGEGIVRGPMNSPELNLTMAWPDGRLTIPRHNTAFAASASFNLLREGLQISDLRLTDPDGGTAQIDGWLRFNEYRYLSYDLESQLNALQVMNVPTFTRDLAFYGDLRASGDATLTGPSASAFLRSDNLVTTPQSELLIPIRDLDAEVDPGFIIYADSTRSITEQISAIRAREHLLDRRPEGERDFRTGLDMDLNMRGPPGSSIRLVIDPLLGDVINGIGTARVQVQRQEGQMLMYGSFDLTSGDYLFTAGEVFVRRFLISEGMIVWEGDPTNPRLDIQASYRTRASRSGLPDDVGGRLNTSLPLIVELHITGTLNAVQVGLNLAIDQRREAISDSPLLEGYLNQPDRAAEHATSVLLTNSFLLSAQGGSTDVLAGSAFNSVSSLVANQLNRYLGQVIPNADFTLGVQSDEAAADLDVSAGIALRLLDERLVIRGLGVYRNLNAPEETAQLQGLEGEFVVELRLRPNVAVEVFYRRESDALSETLMTSETGLGINYRAEFVSWKRLWRRIFRKEPSDLTARSTERAQ